MHSFDYQTSTGKNNLPFALYSFSSRSTASIAEDTDFSASAVAFRIRFLLACFVTGTLDLNRMIFAHTQISSIIFNIQINPQSYMYINHPVIHLFLMELN